MALQTETNNVISAKKWNNVEDGMRIIMKIVVQNQVYM